MVKHPNLKTAGALLLILALGGCGTQGNNLVAVTGQVLVDGKPLTTGMVTTTPERGRGSRGKIDSDGRFMLDSGDLGTGASVGAHGVAVIAVEQSDAFNPEAARTSLIPERYASPATSGLVIDVVPGQTNEVTLKLSSK